MRYFKSVSFIVRNVCAPLNCWMQWCGNAWNPSGFGTNASICIAVSMTLRQMATIKILESQVLTCSLWQSKSVQTHRSLTILVDGNDGTILFLVNRLLQITIVVDCLLSLFGGSIQAHHTITRGHEARPKNPTIALSLSLCSHWIIQHRQTDASVINKCYRYNFLLLYFNVNRNTRRPRFLLGMFSVFFHFFPDIFIFLF